MQQGPIRRGALENKVFAWAQNRDVRAIRSGDLVKYLGFTKRQEEALLYHMGKTQRIAKIRRGLYLVPRNIPLGGKWKPSPLAVVPVLMRELGTTAWQITGPVAFQRHGLSQQVPTRIDVYNDKLSARKTILNQEYRFIKVHPRRLGYTVEFAVTEREGSYQILMSSAPRAVFDAIYDYDRFGVLPDAYEWIRSRVKDTQFMKAFVGIVLKLGNVAVRRRVGYVLDATQAGSRWTRPIRATLRRSKGMLALDPSRGRQGKSDKKWGIIVHAE
jgi:predicted transcriptional regulator of viral defense system